MKIAYIVDYYLSENSGVIQKIKQQSLTWAKKGHVVYLISLKTMKIYDINYRELFHSKSFSLPKGRFGTALNLLLNSFFINKLLEKVDVDIIYMRYRMYMPFFNQILKKNKVVMEINSDDTVEYKLHSTLTHYYNIITRNLILKNVYAFVSVSEELKNKFSYLKKEIKVIANGIDLLEYHLSYQKNEKPTLVFIGTPNQSWHGVEKIEKMASFFKQYQFYVIGIDKKDTENIKYFGYLTKVKATDIIKNCDIGIGTLSLYKTGLSEASPLKTRQYLACGLPVIYAYKDTDFSDDMDFALRLDNKEDNIEYDKILEFVDKVFNSKTLKKCVRNFAEDILDYDRKEGKRLTFFERIKDEK